MNHWNYLCRCINRHARTSQMIESMRLAANDTKHHDPMNKIILNSFERTIYAIPSNPHDSTQSVWVANGWHWEWKRGAWIAPISFDNLKFAQSVLRLPEQDYQMLLSELIDHNDSILAQSRADRASERSFDQWMKAERL